MSEIDILSLLDSVKEDVLIKRHPLADEDMSLRFAYAVGVGVVAHADGPLNETEQAALKDLAAGLLIPAEQTNKVLATASKPDKANITDLLGALTRREQQYLFLLDLRAMANRDGVVSETEQKTIEQFAALFKMSGADLDLWRKLEEAVFAEDFASSEKLFQEAYQEKDADETGVEGLAPYRALAYFWRSEAIRDELVEVERGIAELKEEYASVSGEELNLGSRPKPRRYINRGSVLAMLVSQKKSGGDWEKNQYLDEMSDEQLKEALEFHSAFASMKKESYEEKINNTFNHIDDSQGISWDETHKQYEEKKQNLLSCISAAESRRDSLAAAIDGMYVGNIA